MSNYLVGVYHLNFLLIQRQGNANTVPVEMWGILYEYFAGCRSERGISIPYI